MDGTNHPSGRNVLCVQVPIARSVHSGAAGFPYGARVGVPVAVIFGADAPQTALGIGLHVRDASGNVAITAPIEQLTNFRRSVVQAWIGKQEGRGSGTAG